MSEEFPFYLYRRVERKGLILLSAWANVRISRRPLFFFSRRGDRKGRRSAASLLGINRVKWDACRAVIGRPDALSSIPFVPLHGSPTSTPRSSDVIPDSNAIQPFTTRSRISVMKSRKNLSSSRHLCHLFATRWI